MQKNDRLVTSPIFIGGMFKSGTSLLRAMIGNHSMVASGLETYWFDIDWQNLQSDDSCERLRVIREFYELDVDLMNGMITASDSAEDFLTKLMSDLVEKKGKVRWAEKTPGNIMHLDRIHAFWHDAVIIHIIRDPRDIFSSLREAEKWDTVEQFMKRWSAVFGSLENFRKDGLLDRANYFEVRYENLVQNPEEVMLALCDYMYLPFEPEIAAFKGKSKDFEKVQFVTGKNSTTLARLTQPMTSSRLGIWESILSDQDLKDLSTAAEAEGLGQAFRKVCV